MDVGIRLYLRWVQPYSTGFEAVYIGQSDDVRMGSIEHSTFNAEFLMDFPRVRILRRWLLNVQR